ncbi:MAG: ATP-dependent DNA helicase [Verrucomicrobia bacterium]|nr:ATP-dependent DNA helicase [Verrucomicrobiota bacterium]
MLFQLPEDIRAESVLAKCALCTMPKLRLTISVRELVEFILRTGNLGGSGRFVSTGRALAGTRGHQRLQRLRPADCETEVPVSYQDETPEFIFTLRGRIDVVRRSPESLFIEEIKTTMGRVSEADPMHWAQAKIYAAIYLQTHSCERVGIQITYLDLESNELNEYQESFRAVDLRNFFNEVMVQYLDWITDYVQWRSCRDRSIVSMAFPFQQYRKGQRELCEAVYRVLTHGGNLFAEAPTGIGKTVSVLYPALKALSAASVTTIFYLTAKTIGRTVAGQAIEELRRAGLRLRSLTLTAREKICFNNGQPCDVQTCPFAIGYYDRVKPAMKAALARETITRPIIEEVARAFQVCPFELSLDLSIWVDAIICDYNYVFDPRVQLKHFFAEDQTYPGRSRTVARITELPELVKDSQNSTFSTRATASSAFEERSQSANHLNRATANNYALLIDEAHNLVDRAREMFSADLRQSEIVELCRLLRDDVPACAYALRQVNKELLAWGKRGIDETCDNAPSSFVLRECPSALVSSLQIFLEHAELWLAQNRPALFRDVLLELYFKTVRFVRTADLFDERFVAIFDHDLGKPRLRLFCLDASALIRKTLGQGRGIFFSATLSPLDYFREVLGGSREDSTLRLASPFPGEHLGVLVADRIATNFKAREATYDHVACAIAGLVEPKRGNYLAYFPSYKYLDQVMERFRSLAPEVKTIAQRPSMTEEERAGFLKVFQTEHPEGLVGFAVMGGIFGEGIDLAGDRLIGAIVVGVGLPQICLERDLIRGYFEEKRGAGFDYAYTFPGMNRVLQAAGRVIRSETDRGVVLLIDSRFAQTRYRELFPSWWNPTSIQRAECISKAIRKFWNE